jgi:hypothetical protein
MAPEGAPVVSHLPYGLSLVIQAFAEGVTPTGRTYCGKPLTVAQVRADPFKDPAGAHLLGIPSRVRLPAFMCRKGYR